jgi:hypothetical protein
VSPRGILNAAKNREARRMMIAGTVKNGHVVLDQPSHLPEGTRVEVMPISPAHPAQGMHEEDWPTTPDGIAALLARMDELESGWLDAEDESAWRAALHEQREHDKRQSDLHAERTRRVWE